MIIEVRDISLNITYNTTWRALTWQISNQDSEYYSTFGSNIICTTQKSAEELAAKLSHYHQWDIRVEQHVPHFPEQTVFGVSGGCWTIKQKEKKRKKK
jgi:hypothetical protein